MRGKPERVKSWLASQTQLLCSSCRHLQASWCLALPRDRGRSRSLVCIPTLRPAPMGFRPVLAVGFQETMSWAGRRHATQGHDLMRGHGFGGHPRPQPRRAGDAGTDRAVGHRRRQSRRGHRSHPRARSQDHAPEHGPCPLQGGGGSHPRQRQRRAHQSDHRAGRALRAGRRGPAKARSGHAPSRARPSASGTWSRSSPTSAASTWAA